MAKKIKPDAQIKIEYHANFIAFKIRGMDFDGDEQCKKWFLTELIKNLGNYIFIQPN